MKKAGTPRSEYTRAKISLWFFAYNKYIPQNCFGYVNNLNFYGPVSWDGLNQLKRFLPETVYKKIKDIMLKSDADATKAES